MQKKNLLILGCGRCVWEDYFKAKELVADYDLMCINHMAVTFSGEPVQHSVSLHRQSNEAHKASRKHTTVHGCNKTAGVDRVWNDKGKCLSNSGIYGTLIAIDLGYNSIVLCGIPHDNRGHFYDPPESIPKEVYNRKRWYNYGGVADKSVIEHLSVRNPLVATRVRSMSGLTAETFGKPTKEWVNAIHN